MNLDNFINELALIFEDADPETIKPDVKFREIEGYSSLVAFLLISHINEDYNVNFTMEDLRKSITFNDILTIIKSKQ